jgi:hypothetical protein
MSSDKAIPREMRAIAANNFTIGLRNESSQTRRLARSTAPSR